MKILGCFKPFFLIFILTNLSVFAQSPNRTDVLNEIESLQTQLKAKEILLLAPAAEDRLAFAEFLKQPGTGLIRLLPREKYDFSGKTMIRGGGAYYSFAKLTHEYGQGSDISLEQGSLSVGFAGANYGFLADLCDVAIESVTLETPALQFPASYEAPTAEAKTRLESRRFGEGVKANEILYKSSLPAVVGDTYILRSINFDTSNVLVIFRVVRKDIDGSLILVWKTLEKFPEPMLERQN